MEIIFSQALTDICEHSLTAPGRPLRCTIIANPTAGGFTIKSRWKRNSAILKDYQLKSHAMQKREIYKNIILHLTEGRGSAGEMTRTLIEKSIKDPVPFNLIISAGGDGTHSEVMYAVYNAPDNVRENMAVLRLPMGTGNDGSDGAFMENALDLLINPSHVEYAPAVQLITSQSGALKDKGPYLAFNILSVGLDAFVTHMTNIMKEKTPGDSYKLWLDIATLFYESKFKVDYFNVKAFDEKNVEVRSFREKLLILVMGASGHRTYGSQHKILPDDRNVCAVKQMPLFSKLAIKGQITKGTHADNPRAFLLSAKRVEFSGLHKILAQMDGETILMQPEDFPAALELTKPVIPLLKLNN